MKQTTYKDSGVDLEIYAESMARLPKLAAQTFSNRVLRLDGGFAGLFKLNSEKIRYKNPVLVSCTDGVGTKLKIACLANRHHTVGIDLVAMSVNDAVCCGAEPLFFLDYVAMPKDDPDLLEQIVCGIVEGCRQSGCALLGGETAIMSDLYRVGEYDLAGFCVGVAEGDNIIDGHSIQSGDVLIGVESAGLHSNGFSLVRKIVFEIARLEINDVIPEFGQSVADILLTPTRIYVECVQKLLATFGANDGIHGIAHITGGGLRENVNRILPQNRKLQIDFCWEIPPIFSWLQKLGNVNSDEMNCVFNMGIGLVLVVRSDLAESIQKSIEFRTWNIGSVKSSS
ncbi:MAG: phosphoribosylformylglycinamidine cyclo-ligase [Planctomycetaceae bacterium]|jgi:phosphoribosylformylglycinamidine cyclo-ligase|nr:phosphoribosylformylglycinamidine cyclo-ligase [Planctomycetaceae bacterium]